MCAIETEAKSEKHLEKSKLDNKKEIGNMLMKVLQGIQVEKISQQAFQNVKVTFYIRFENAFVSLILR
jgi:hypothetical protein